MDRDTARVLGELRVQLEYFATRTDVLTSLVISMARFHPQRDALLREWDLAPWDGAFVGPPVTAGDAWTDLIDQQHERMRESCDRPPVTSP